MTVYCEGEKYISKADEICRIGKFLSENGVTSLALAVASSIGADLAMAFLAQTKLPVRNVFFDGGQFAQIGKGTRRIMTPFIYFAIKSIYKSNGGTLKKVMWCDDDFIKPYFIEAGRILKYGNLRRQLADSLENKPFPKLPEELESHMFFEFGSAEEHFKYRDGVMKGNPARRQPFRSAKRYDGVCRTVRLRQIDIGKADCGFLGHKGRCDHDGRARP